MKTEDFKFAMIAQNYTQRPTGSLALGITEDIASFYCSLLFAIAKCKIHLSVSPK
jgi:hypothetical protein